MDRQPPDVKELLASRARLVSSADEERRGLERALHDGVQQQLVAIAVELQLALQLQRKNPAAAAASLEQVRRSLLLAVAELRAFAELLYPPLLDDQGLGAALIAAAAHAGVPAHVELPLRSLRTRRGRANRLPLLRARARRLRMQFAGRQARGRCSPLRGCGRRRARRGRGCLVTDRPRPRTRRTAGLGGLAHHGFAARGPVNVMSAPFGEIEDDGSNPFVDCRLPAEPELQEDRVDDLLDRPLREEERRPRSQRCSCRRPSP